VQNKDTLQSDNKPRLETVNDILPKKPYEATDLYGDIREIFQQIEP